MIAISRSTTSFIFAVEILPAWYTMMPASAVNNGLGRILLPWCSPPETKSTSLRETSSHGFHANRGAHTDIYPVEARKEPNLSYRLLRAIYPAFRVLFPNQVIRADDLGRAMVDIAVRGPVESEARILENRDIRAMVRS